MDEPLQRFADHVINRGLHFLNARNVIAADNQRKIGEAAAQNFAAVVTQQRYGQHFAFPRFFERRDDVARTAASGNSNRYIVRLGLRNQLPKKNNFGADVVADGRDIGGVERRRNGGGGVSAPPARPTDKRESGWGGGGSP